MIVGEKGLFKEENVKMEILLLFGMIRMNCVIEEDKESRCIFK